MEPLIPYYQVPVIHIGPLPIHGFGMLVAMGFLFGGNAAMRRAEATGLDPEAINKLLGYLVAGTFFGGHVGYGLMYEPAEYFADPKKFLYVWQGLSSFGGFVVCVPLSFWFFHKHKLKIWPYMDSLAIGLALGWFFGRMGCTVAHDHPGFASDFWLAKYCRPVVGHTLELPSFLVDSGHDLRWGPCASVGNAVTDIAQQVPADFGGVVAAHDMGFYEALWSIAVFGLFLALDRVPRKPGFYVTLLGVLYAPVRFGMDFLRPNDTRYLSLTPAQYWSILFLLFSGYGLWLRLRTTDRPVGPTAPMTPDEGGFDPETGRNGVA